MDAHLPREICAATRRMAAVRVELRSRTDDLWQARAAKQRRLGLDQLDTLTSTTRGSLSHVEGGGEESGGQAASNGFGGGVEALGMEEGGGGDGADRVGTLLVRMGRLDGVEGVGLFNPNAVATLMLEESSASVEEMEMEKACTKVCQTHHVQHVYKKKHPPASASVWLVSWFLDLEEVTAVDAVGAALSGIRGGTVQPSEGLF